MSMQYSDKVLEHFSSPRNMGEIEDADGRGEVGNPICGDLMRITIKVNDATEVIEDIKFTTFGCGAAIASSSVLTELIKGKTVTEALEVTNRDVVDELGGLPAIKLHCSVLAEQGIVTALRDYYRQHPEKQIPPELAEKAGRLEKADAEEVGAE